MRLLSPSVTSRFVLHHTNRKAVLTCERRFFAASPTKGPLGRHSRAERKRAQAAHVGSLLGAFAIASGAGSFVLMARAEPEADPVTVPVKMKQRHESFPLAQESGHSHGAERVRVLKVNRIKGEHYVQEYSISTTIYSSQTADAFVKGENDKIIAHDTLKNIAFVVAKKFDFASPEEYALLLSHYIMVNYPWLDAVDVQVDQSVWERANVAAYKSYDNIQPHPHGFVRTSPETQHAEVHLERGNSPIVTSSLSNMTLLKTTQSGFEGYHHDSYTTLAPTSEQTLACQMKVVWSYRQSAIHNFDSFDYVRVRQRVRQLLLKGYFGPPPKGIYSPSLQATVYDSACMVLHELPYIQAVTIRAPSISYQPTKDLLEALGDSFEDDVYLPRNEPIGVVTCTVTRETTKAKSTTVTKKDSVNEDKKERGSEEDPEDVEMKGEDISNFITSRPQMVRTPSKKDDGTDDDKKKRKYTYYIR